MSCLYKTTSQAISFTCGVKILSFFQMAHALVRTCRTTFSPIFRSLPSLVPVVALLRTITSVPPTSQEYRTADIQKTEPNYPIVGQLSLFIRQNPIMALIHGMWMGYWDDQGLVSLLNKKGPFNDRFYARRDWNTLDADQRAQLRAFWQSEKGRDKDFWSNEFVKHALTAHGCYKPRYFLDSVECARPFMAGGLKDLVPFIEQNFDMGKVYPIQDVQKVFSGHISARVRIVHENKHLSGLVMAYLEDRNKFEKPLVLTDHPPVSYKEKHIVVRVPPPLKIR